jgi:hypothetical protein
MNENAYAHVMYTSRPARPSRACQVFAWEPSDMTEDPSELIKHHLGI